MAENEFAELARRLGAKAAGDAAALRELVDKEHVPDSAVGFFAQQAAEKALKAVLARRGVPVSNGRTTSPDSRSRSPRLIRSVRLSSCL